MEKISYLGPARNDIGEEMPDYVVVRKDKLDTLNDFIDSLGGVEQIPRANAGLASGEDRGKCGPQNAELADMIIQAIEDTPTLTKEYICHDDYHTYSATDDDTIKGKIIKLLEEHFVCG